jgi:hypothetical protein
MGVERGCDSRGGSAVSAAEVRASTKDLAIGGKYHSAAVSIVVEGLKLVGQLSDHIRVDKIVRRSLKNECGNVIRQCDGNGIGVGRHDLHGLAIWAHDLARWVIDSSPVCNLVFTLVRCVSS